MGVLGSGENRVKKFREQGAWGQKDQGAGSKGNTSGPIAPPYSLLAGRRGLNFEGAGSGGPPMQSLNTYHRPTKLFAMCSGLQSQTK